ncbi:hypothetical protein AUJ93_03310 [bacterium CG2_30_33_46]|nr:MAG: hypothetical protein AUJ93_03310 [bacterium CG2_30_33_46]PIR67205.1 MAG: hypothetical protein COU50_04610 [bacterium CG10_big_fil_rev_8_21_14_0_10_33_18]PIY85615.1 MAG: hypothetical protein COY76_01340 [bacterium CG_4_10_14_0_8_um_filter_33_57]PJA72426.1 MAG: hypothetical protein CO152_01495 [bacterium CG_4_9_14_3_um_filter_33_26]
MFLIASSFIIPEKDLIYLTFFGSLFLDLFSPMNFGFQILINIMIIFFVLLASYFIFSNVSFVLLLVLAILSTVISDVFYGLALYLSGFKIDIIFFAKNFLVSKIIVNSIIIMIIYPVVDLGWERISKIEGRVKLLR